MAESRSLFTVLLGQPWWISALVGVGLFGIAQMAFPPVAPFVAMPFFGISLYVGYRQLRTVSPGKVEERLAALRELSWEPFSAIVTDAYRRQGYTVDPADKSAFDFKLEKQGRLTLLQCRRWKVKQLGVGPLEDLAKAILRENAYNGICLCTGEFTSTARGFVANKPISLVHGIELAALVGKVVQGK